MEPRACEKSEIRRQQKEKRRGGRSSWSYYGINRNGRVKLILDRGCIRNNTIRPECTCGIDIFCECCVGRAVRIRSQCMPSISSHCADEHVYPPALNGHRVDPTSAYACALPPEMQGLGCSPVYPRTRHGFWSIHLVSCWSELKPLPFFHFTPSIHRNLQKASQPERRRSRGATWPTHPPAPSPSSVLSMAAEETSTSRCSSSKPFFPLCRLVCFSFWPPSAF